MAVHDAVIAHAVHCELSHHRTLQLACSPLERVWACTHNLYVLSKECVLTCMRSIPFAPFHLMWCDDFETTYTGCVGPLI
jgi:hypothetical protein